MQNIHASKEEVKLALHIVIKFVEIVSDIRKYRFNVPDNVHESASP